MEEKEEFVVPVKMGFSRPLAWGLVGLFLLLIGVPALWDNGVKGVQVLQKEEGVKIPWVHLFSFSPSEGSLQEHLKGAEKEVEEAVFVPSLRRAWQAFWLRFLGKGNRKTFVGREGVLFYKPALDALTGYGPLQKEPDSVAKNPARSSWQSPLEVIVDFGKQLRSHGVSLVLVPVPTKAMVYPEFLGNLGNFENVGEKESALRHPDAEMFFNALREGGVEVVDLLPVFLEEKARVGEKGEMLFLRQDTHWNPRGMEVAVREVANFLNMQHQGQAKYRASVSITKGRPQEGWGDLVSNLDLLKPEHFFQKEKVIITGDLGGQIRDASAEVVLLGDSFVNIFSDKKLGFGEDSGFAELLSFFLGNSLDTIAINGQGATGVRKEFARRVNSEGGGEFLQGEKTVLWVLSERDLFLSGAAAREAGVEWERVSFEENKTAVSMAGDFFIEATVEEIVVPPAPEEGPYQEALYAVTYRLDEVLEGEFEAERFVVMHWAFRDKKRVPSAFYKKGEKHQLRLVGFDQKKSLKTVQRKEAEDFLLPLFYAEEIIVK